MENVKIVFLDRDGVINHNTPGNYVRNIHEFRLLPNVKESLARLTRAGYEIHIVSNQQGIAKGLMTMTQLAEVTRLMLDRLENAGVKIQSINYCTHLELEKCKCRKPKPGLLLGAVEGRRINFRKTWMIGDSWRDIESGRSLGCRTIWLGDSKSKKGKFYYHDNHNIQLDYCVKDLSEAVKLILKKNDIKKSIQRRK